MDATTQAVLFALLGVGLAAGVVLAWRVSDSQLRRHRSTGGTGLGLSIVKHVAASHGGEVRVWSVQNQGSTFTLSLPRTTPDAYPALPDPTTPTTPSTPSTAAVDSRQEAS